MSIKRWRRPRQLFQDGAIPLGKSGPDLLNRVADLISERLFEISAAVSMEVGKNRLEAIGDVEEAADLIRYCVDAIRDNQGFDRQLLSETDQHFNRSVLKPYGVWGGDRSLSTFPPPSPAVPVARR